MPQKTPKQKPTRVPKDGAMSFQLESELKDQIEEIAIAEDRSVGSVLREAIKQYIKARTQVAA